MATNNQTLHLLPLECGKLEHPGETQAGNGENVETPHRQDRTHSTEGERQHNCAAIFYCLKYPHATSEINILKKLLTQVENKIKIFQHFQTGNGHKPVPKACLHVVRLIESWG